MRNRASFMVTAGLLGILAVGPLGAGQGQAPPGQGQAGEDKERDADGEAIRKAAREFGDAFAKGDAKSLASHWTPQGEYEDERGEVLRGQADIEKAYAELFKDKSQGTIEIDVRSIRFPSRDSAIEEGFLRHTPSGAGLPASTLYSAVHVREGGAWKIALAREWAAGQDRLGDLAWLIGSWEGGPKGQEVGMKFERDGTTPFIIGRFTKKNEGRVVTGTMKIGLDAGRGQLRSWHFDNDGGHGQCLWIRDGSRWVLDAIGALPDGTETAAVNVLARLGTDEFTWRSMDRVAGGEPLPDTLPVKLTRVRAQK
jgi:uncharacterized protein (TIGR02246 family)